MIDGLTISRKQIQSFEMSSASLSDDFVNQNDLPKPDKVGFLNQFYKNATLRTSVTSLTQGSFGSFSGTNLWSGAVYSRNYKNPTASGLVWGIPRNASSILRIDTNTNTSTTLGSLGAGTNKWFGGVLWKNYIIFSAFARGTIGIFDLLTETLREIPTGNTSAWQLTMSEDGKLYSRPSTTGLIMCFDPLTENIEYIQTVLTQNDHDRPCLAFNGKLYFAPVNGTTVGVFDPKTRISYRIGNVTGTNVKFNTLIPAENGMLYAGPRSATSVLKVNPYTDEVTQFGSVAVGSNKYYAGCYARNGLIVYPVGINPGTLNSLLINTNTDTVSEIALSSGGDYYGAVQAQNFVIYCIPWSTTTTMPIQTFGITNYPLLSVKFCESKLYNHSY